MKPAPIPENDADRLRALRRYRVLDIASESPFDDLVAIAAHILDVPIALVSLIDVDRQWFKARYGLDAPETGRDISFCGHAVASGELLVVPDATKDPRFADNPLVTGAPHVTFYAGAPLTTPDGFALGTLCAIDTRPRQVTKGQLDALAALSHQTIQLLEYRRQRFESELRQRMLEASPALAAVLTLEGHPIEFDSHWTQLLGRTEKSLAGTAIEDVVHPDDLGRVLSTLTELRETGRPAAIETRFRCGDGSYRSLLLAAAPDLAQERLYLCGVDVTDRSKLREMQDGFVSVVSHELRTPLTSIFGALSLLDAGVVGELPGEAAGLIHIARGNCERLIRLVNDILDVERIRAGHTQMQLADTSLDDLVRQCADEARGFASGFGVTIVLERVDAVTGSVDRDRVLQAMTNLLSNASKFSPAGAQVSVKAFANDALWRVEIQDRGPGLKDEDRARVFERFVQAESGDARPHSGTGLGLAITKAIIGEHHGTIGVDSVLGQGCTFWFEIPLHHE